MNTVLFTDKSKKGNKMDLVLFIASKWNTVQQILVREKMDILGYNSEHM